MKIALVCDFPLYRAYKRFISVNSENSVQNVLFRGNKCLFMGKPCSKLLSTLNSVL